MASAALAMAVWHFFEGRKRMARSTPTAVWLVLSALLIFAVVSSLSRGAMITLAVFLVAALAAFQIVRSSHSVPSTMPRLVSVALLLVFIGAGAFVVRHVDFSAVERKFSELTRLKANEPSVSGRALVREASLDMWHDNWALGTGAASFRYLFPKYLQHYPAIYEGGLWEHAHIDWLQIPIELGLTGVLLIAGAVGWVLLKFFGLRGWRHGLATILFVGSTQTLMHAFGDFPFQNAAILIAWWSLLIIALRWLEIDSAAEGRLGNG